MGRLDDRKRARRRYIGRKTIARLFGVITKPLVRAAHAGLEFAVPKILKHGGGEPDSLVSWLGRLVYLIFIVMCYIPLAIVSRLQNTHDDLDSTPYLPPVTLSNLPDDETLLRAGVKGEETKADELLRSHLP
jgi:hypothetical protein